MTSAAREASRLDRFLRLFTEVRSGESPTVLLLALNLFVLLTAYSVLKVVREPLILAGGGSAEIRSYSAAGQALLLLVAVPAYGALAARLPRRRLITVVTLFFVACLAAFFVLAQLKVRVGVPFFIWLGIFNLMIISQLWAFANDVYTTEEGKRLFPIVGFGASAGAVVGSWLPGQLRGVLSIEALMILAAVLLVVTVLLTIVVDARERRRTEAAVPDANTSGMMPAATPQLRAETGEFKLPSEQFLKASGEVRPVRPVAPGAEPERPTPTGGAFRLVFTNRYLLLIALLMLVLNSVNSTGEYVLARTVRAAAQAAVAGGAAGGMSEDQFILSFSSRYQSGVNLASLLLQLFVVSRVLKFFGVRLAIRALPVIAAFGYGVLAFVPLLGVVRWAKTAENATDYSLQNTVRNVLFLPTTREQKYAAKQAIDGFFVRAGDLLQAGLVYAGTTAFAFGARQFALVNLALVMVWLGLAAAIGRRYERLATATTGL